MEYELKSETNEKELRYMRQADFRMGPQPTTGEGHRQLLHRLQHGGSASGTFKDDKRLIH